MKMKINYNVKGPKRKALVNAISQELNVPVKYLGAPTFAYEVADYNIDKNGVLSGPDNSELVGDLLRLHDFKSISEEFETPFQKTEATETEEAINLVIQMPLADFTDMALENLKGLVESKEALIKTALDTDSIPINVTEEFVAFPWFQGECSAEEVKAYTHFITALCEMAKKQTRVNSTEKSVENEKYAFRCFLLRLGFIGPEYKTERKILLSKLSGSSAFKSGAAKQEVSEQ
jgi:hypothetical protein